MTKCLNDKNDHFKGLIKALQIYSYYPLLSCQNKSVPTNNKGFAGQWSWFCKEMITPSLCLGQIKSLALAVQTA